MNLLAEVIAHNQSITMVANGELVQVVSRLRQKSELLDFSKDAIQKMTIDQKQAVIRDLREADAILQSVLEQL